MTDRVGPRNEFGSIGSSTSPNVKPRYTIPKSSAPIIPAGPSYSVKSISSPSSPFPRPTRKEDGTLVFQGRWKGVFTPNVTPEEMFSGGAFAGAFFWSVMQSLAITSCSYAHQTKKSDTYSNVLKTPLPAQVDLRDLPFSFSSSRSEEMLSNSEPKGELNRFRVRAGQSLQEWEKAGWIWPGDPRGWAQWYVRFWAGRRSADDERQIRRCGYFSTQFNLIPDAHVRIKGLKVAGPTGRFKRALLKVVHNSGGEEALSDERVGKVLRQCLWQWGYELNEVEYRRAMAGNG